MKRHDTHLLSDESDKEKKEEDVPKTDTGVPLVGIVAENSGSAVPKTDGGTPLVDVVADNAPTKEVPQEEPVLTPEAESNISEPILEEEKEPEGFAVPELVDNAAFTDNTKQEAEIDELKIDDDDDSLDPEDFS